MPLSSLWLLAFALRRDAFVEPPAMLNLPNRPYQSAGLFWPIIALQNEAPHTYQRSKIMPTTTFVKLVAALGLAGMLAMATANSFAQSNRAMDCYPRNGVSTC
jgi:hypothetical protein